MSLLTHSLAPLARLYDAALLDLDGTLLDGRGQLTDRTIRAVRALEGAGIRVVLCTGRSLASARRMHEALGVGEWLVAYNGAWIGPPEGPPDRFVPIPPQTYETLFSLEAQALFSFRHVGEFKYTRRCDHPDYAPVAQWYENVRILPESEDVPPGPMMRLSLFFDGPEAAPAPDSSPSLGLDPATQGPPEGLLGEVTCGRAAHHARWAGLSFEQRELLRREVFPLRIFPEYRHSRLELCEIQGACDGKAEAYAVLAARHGIPAHRVFAAGDHGNDLSMLDRAGLAVAMGNAAPAIKARAHLVIGLHTEEGFARWIEAGAPLPADRG